jgi:GNAT superfamily N-acetyltransferase
MGSATAEEVRVCGRTFSARDLDVVRRIVASDPRPHRSEIARRTCESLDWRRPDGRLKEMSCRVALLRLEDRGLILLPPPLCGNGNRQRHRLKELVPVPSARVTGSVGGIPGLFLRPVATRAESRLWNSAVARHHYLGYQPLPGAQVRYLLTCDSGLLAVLGFGASAWKVAPRDRFIGWSREQREARLHLVVDNARFLVLPSVRSRNLASWVLTACARRLRADFQERYGYGPVLLETFVERERFTGACYKAAGWEYVGDTKGRGKLDRHHLKALPVKRVFVKPLVPDFRQVLCG